MIAARRRPLAIGLVFLVEAVAAWVLAAPWAEVFARALGAHPDGDRALWLRPGLPLLIDLQRRLGGVVFGLGAATAIGLAVFAVFGVFVLGALLSALAEPSQPLARAAGRGVEVFFRLLFVAAIGFAIGAFSFVVLGVVPARVLAAQLGASPRAAALASLAPLLLAFALVLAVWAATDLSRARVVRHDEGVLDAIVGTLRAPRVVLAQLALATPRWVASLGLLGWAAALTTHASSLFVVFVIHQVVALLRVGLRASVLARALRLAGPREVPSP